MNNKLSIKTHSCNYILELDGDWGLLIDYLQLGLRIRSMISLLNTGVELARSLMIDRFNNKTYHNQRHFDDIVCGSRQMVDLALNDGVITKNVGDLIVIAAAFHDVVQGLGADESERQSAREAVSWMGDSFSDIDKNLVEEMIMGTVVNFEKSGKMHQRAEDSNRICVKILADADLANIGLPWEVFVVRLLGLWNEIKGSKYNLIEEMTSDEQRNLWLFQKKFMDNREYLTKYAQSIFVNLDENRKLVNKKLRQLGDVKIVNE